MENPYSAPQAASAADRHYPDALDPERERLAQLGEVIVAWERLRIWYNFVLALTAMVGILLVRPHLLIELDSLRVMFLAAIGANACFCVGPILEGYTTWWFGPAPWLRSLVFMIGTLGAVTLTLVVVAALGIENWHLNQD